MTKRVVAIYSVLVVVITLLAVFVPSCGGGGVVPMATFVAHFMTPEGEPYPFDSVTVSNGTWRKEFNNVTAIDTEVPTKFTLTYSYVLDGVYKTVVRGIQLSFAAGEERGFTFYAINWTNAAVRVRPYLTAAEEPVDDVNLTWAYNNITNTLSYNLTRQSPKWAMVSGIFDANERENLNWGISNVSTCGTEYEKCSEDAINISTKQTIEFYHFPAAGTQPPEQIPLSVSGSLAFQPISEDLGCLRIKHVMYEDSLVASVTNNTLLRSINGTLVPQNFVDPQYAVPEGAYLLEIQDLPTQYFVPKLPVKVLAGINWGYRKTILEINALNTTELNPWKFAIIAELDPLFSFASFSDLTNNVSSKTLSLNVTTKAKMYDWWGCFVLPGTATVTAARAYNGTVWHNLIELYDYTINTAASYDIVCVRITPETERLALNYTTAPPA